MNKEEMEVVEDVFEFEAAIKPQTVQSNIEELKGFIQDVCNSYQGGVVTNENRAMAKADLASLRKLKKAIQDKVTSLKREVLLPWEDFRQEVEKACIPINGLIETLSKGLDKVEAERIEAKRLHVKQLVTDILAEAPEATRVIVREYWNEKWLNATASDKAIKEELDRIIAQTVSTLDAISGSRFEAQLLAKYKQTWSYMEVTKEREALEKQAEEYEKVLVLRAKEKIDKERRESDFHDALAGLGVDAETLPSTESSDDHVLQQSDILFCTCYLVGTLDEIKQGVKSFRFQGGRIVRNSEYRPATEIEVSSSKYQKK